MHDPIPMRKVTSNCANWKCRIMYDKREYKDRKCIFWRSRIGGAPWNILPITKGGVCHWPTTLLLPSLTRSPICTSPSLPFSFSSIIVPSHYSSHVNGVLPSSSCCCGQFCPTLTAPMRSELGKKWHHFWWSTKCTCNALHHCSQPAFAQTSFSDIWELEQKFFDPTFEKLLWILKVIEHKIYVKIFQWFPSQEKLKWCFESLGGVIQHKRKVIQS